MPASLKRNPSMLSSKSKNDDGDNYKHPLSGIGFQPSNSSVLKPVTKKPMVPTSSNNNIQLVDI